MRESDGRQQKRRIEMAGLLAELAGRSEPINRSRLGEYSEALSVLVKRGYVVSSRNNTQYTLNEDGRVYAQGVLRVFDRLYED